MPTQIGRSYEKQGYLLPEGFTWAMVAERRARWGIADIFVPVAVARGCVGWGVPYIGGVPLEHHDRAPHVLGQCWRVQSAAACSGITACSRGSLDLSPGGAREALTRLPRPATRRLSARVAPLCGAARASLGRGFTLS